MARRVLRTLTRVEWFQDGATHHYDDPGPGEGKVTNLPYGQDLKVGVELDGVAFLAETRTWTSERVCVHWHDEQSWYRTCWVPKAAVRRATDEEFRAAVRARLKRMLGRPWDD